MTISPQIVLIYPTRNHRVYDDSTFVMGQITTVHPRYTFQLSFKDNESKKPAESISFSPQGFFSWPVTLQEGNNQLTFQVFDGSEPLAELTYSIYRVPAYRVKTTGLPVLYPETLTPKKECWLSETSRLPISLFIDQTNATVSVELPELNNNNATTKKPSIKLSPLLSAFSDSNETSRSVDTREIIFARPHWTMPRIPVEGYYQGELVAEMFWPFLEKQKTVSGMMSCFLTAKHLQDKSGSDNSCLYLDETNPSPSIFYPDVIIEANGTRQAVNLGLGIRFLSQPLIAQVKNNHAVTRLSPPDGPRTSPQQQGTLVQVTEMIDNWCRVFLTQNRSVFIHHDDLNFDWAFQVKIASLPTQRLQTITVNPQEASNTVVVALSGNFPIPKPYLLTLETPPESGSGYRPGCLSVNRLVAQFYGVLSHCDFVQYAPQETEVRQIHWRSITSNTTEVWIDTKRPMIGYSPIWHAPRNQWEITVKTLPKALSQTRVLIDPGHGGDEMGSVGLNGLPEKALNLTVSRQLKTALALVGFQVFMTRETDQFVSLQARQNIAVAVNADIVLSIHHNALPDGRNPLEERGISTFYYHVFAKPLADTLYFSLTQPPKQNSKFEFNGYGVLYDSLFIPRIHQAASVLLELGFFTHPNDFEQLIHPGYQSELVQRITKGLVTFCKNCESP
ncbi:MAG: N-acetylmuramoyl-L-alanine amidase [Cyanobacteria bacterium P01_H01_bin.74]